MKKIIKLTRGKFAYVDSKDYKRLSKFKWCYSITTDGNEYAVRGGTKPIYMHRSIMNLVDSDSSIYVDHINHNGLDNRRSNLRISNNHLNQFNRRTNKNNTSGYKGVTWDKKAGNWHAQIMMFWKNINLGNFKNKEEAYRARIDFENKYL